MLKSKKKNSAGSNSQGVYSKGNSLRRHWLSALLVSVISIGAGFAYLILVHGVAVQNAQIQRVVDNIAETQAANIQLLFRSIEERLLAAASSPLAIAAIATGITDDIALVEKTMLDYFPEAISLRFITIGSLGTAGLEGSNLGLRNHIEVDLLRRTSEGAETVPESYQFEGTWLTSMAAVTVHPQDDNKRALILATIDNQVINGSLSALDIDRGRTSLQQIFRRREFTRFDEIATVGSGAAGQYQSSVKLNSGNWTLVFTPSAGLLSELQINYLPITIVLAAILLTVLIAMLIEFILYQRSLAAEVEHISAGAEKRTPLAVSIPQLLPLAEQLRLAASKPGQRAAKPRQSAAKPGQIAAKPGQTAAIPGQTAAIPGQTAAIPGQTAAIPGQSAAIPGQSAAIPGQTAAKPGQTAAKPGQSTAASARNKPPQKRSVVENKSSDPVIQPAETPGQKDVDDSDITANQLSEPTASNTGGSFPSHIFRAYDIRGIVPDELNGDLVTQIGGAIGTLAGELEQQALIVGCDGRNSSPALKNLLIKALLASGRDVIDIGTVPTPLLYYASHTLSASSGVMVTGSHNPAEYNGLKITIDGQPLAGKDLEQLRDRVAQGDFSEGAGHMLKKDIRKDYIDAIVGDMAIASPLKIVVDAGNGVAGGIAPQLLEELGCEVVPLYCDVDGDFPNHHPDPSVDENLGDLQARVLEEEADIGIAYDGDGDRLAVVSATGEIVRTDKLIMLYAQDVLSRNPGADVVFDVKCSRHLTQLVSRYGGRPILWKTGHAFMRQKIIETGALLGGEFSGHIYFGERWFGFDDGLYASARLVEILTGAGMDLESLLSDFPNTESTAEIRIPVSDDKKFDLMFMLERKGDFSPGKVNHLDGIRVDYNDGWGLLRASNTVPALVARFEAHDADALERIKQQFRKQLAAIEPGLDPGF